MTKTFRGYKPPTNLSKGDGAAGCLLLAIILFVFLPIVVVLSGLITLLAWNVGVVGIVAAAGGTVSKIGLGIAICANLAIGVLSRVFRSPTVPNTTSK